MKYFSSRVLLLVCGAAAFSSMSSVRAEETPLRQRIDAAVRAAWQTEGITPAPAADDAAFLRRLYLDLLGTIPSAEETVAFLKDTEDGKRARLIDKLLDDPRHIDHQTTTWDQLYFGRNPPDSELTNRRDGFRKWLRARLAANEPYDRWARELLTGDGATQDGPAMFFAQFRGKPEDTTEAVSRLFLGTQIHCARCHDHPFDKWKQTDFYGMAGFFVRMNFIEANHEGKRHYILAEKSSGEVLFTGPAAEQTPGKKGEPVPARFLGGELLSEPELPKGFKEPELKGNKNPPRPLFSRKQKFAEWATAVDNPYFTKAIVNRVWAQYMGRGLVHPVDDIRVRKPASHPELFEKLQEELVAHQYDLKWLTRELVNSQTYQLSSRNAVTDALPLQFERARVRPLTAEEMIASFRVATGFDAAVRVSGGKPEATKTPEEVYFMLNFGRPLNGRGEFQPGLNEHLFLNNSSALRQAMIQPRKGNLTDSIINSKATLEERVDQMFLAVLTRFPRDQERAKFVEYLSADKTALGPAVEEAVWVLLNTAEFRFNH
jgi:Protein of unknown function (DUF1549)/Protein of unknown function (DUF1553)